MTIKSTLSVLALLSGVAFAGSAYAQTTVGNNDVSDADLPIVQAHCDALLLADENSSTAGENPNDTEVTDGEATGVAADTESRNTSTTVDLDTITLEDCRTAGLIN